MESSKERTEGAVAIRILYRIYFIVHFEEFRSSAVNGNGNDYGNEKEVRHWRGSIRSTSIEFESSLCTSIPIMADSSVSSSSPSSSFSSSPVPPSSPSSPMSISSSPSSSATVHQSNCKKFARALENIPFSSSSSSSSSSSRSGPLSISMGSSFTISPANF